MTDEKEGWSEEKEDFFGNKYTQHYDSDGNKTGWSEEKEGFFGGSYTQTYDNDNNKSSWSEEKEGFFGDTYTQHYEGNEYDKSGWSEQKEGFFGGEYDQHYDNDSRKTGWSEEKEGFFGGKYTQHYGDTASTYYGGGSSVGSSGYSGGGSAGSSDYSSDYTSSGSSTGLGGCLAVIAVIGIIVFCGGGIMNVLKSAFSGSEQSTSTSVRTPKGARVISIRANLRQGPEKSSRSIKEIESGVVLQLLSTQYTGNGWYRVKETSSGREGWIHGSTIEFVY